MRQGDAFILSLHNIGRMMVPGIRQPLLQRRAPLPLVYHTLLLPSPMLHPAPVV